MLVQPWNSGPGVRASIVSAGSVSKNLPTQIQALGREDPLEKEMTAHSSILAWKISWTEKIGGLQSWGCKSWTRLSD